MHGLASVCLVLYAEHPQLSDLARCNWKPHFWKVGRDNSLSPYHSHVILTIYAASGPPDIERGGNDKRLTPAKRERIVIPAI